VSRDGAAAAPVEQQAITLARETTALLSETSALIGEAAEWADWALAGGAPPRYVAQQMITAGRLIAAAARGEAAVI
jgi:hypothetical protein